MKKYLCCCQGGKVRSVGTKYVLNDFYKIKSVLTCGLENTDPDTLETLFQWADIIIVSATPEVAALVPEQFQSKTVLFNVGPDTYHQYSNPKLQRQLQRFVADLFPS